jgi:hypothetical protein
MVATIIAAPPERGKGGYPVGRGTAGHLSTGFGATATWRLCEVDHGAALVRGIRALPPILGLVATVSQKLSFGVCDAEMPFAAECAQGAVHRGEG